MKRQDQVRWYRVGGALVLLLALSGCGITSDNQNGEAGAKKASPSTELREVAIAQSDIYCPSEQSQRLSRVPTAQQAATVQGVADIIHYCFSKTNNQVYCRIVGQEHYLKSGAQRNYLTSDTCGVYNFFDANRNNGGQPYCISGCDS